jgi:hypothetical protein
LARASGLPLSQQQSQLQAAPPQKKLSKQPSALPTDRSEPSNHPSMAEKMSPRMTSILEERNQREIESLRLKMEYLSQVAVNSKQKEVRNSYQIFGPPQDFKGFHATKQEKARDLIANIFTSPTAPGVPSSSDRSKDKQQQQSFSLHNDDDEAEDSEKITSDRNHHNHRSDHLPVPKHNSNNNSNNNSKNNQSQSQSRYGGSTNQAGSSSSAKKQLPLPALDLGKHSAKQPVAVGASNGNYKSKKDSFQQKVPREDPKRYNQQNQQKPEKQKLSGALVERTGFSQNEKNREETDSGPPTPRLIHEIGADIERSLDRNISSSNNNLITDTDNQEENRTPTEELRSRNNTKENDIDVDDFDYEEEEEFIEFEDPFAVPSPNNPRGKLPQKSPLVGKIVNFYAPESPRSVGAPLKTVSTDQPDSAALVDEEMVWTLDDAFRALEEQQKKDKDQEDGEQGGEEEEEEEDELFMEDEEQIVTQRDIVTAEEQQEKETQKDASEQENTFEEHEQEFEENTASSPLPLLQNKSSSKSSAVKFEDPQQQKQPQHLSSKSLKSSDGSSKKRIHSPPPPVRQTPGREEEEEDVDYDYYEEFENIDSQQPSGSNHNKNNDKNNQSGQQLNYSQELFEEDFEDLET